MAWCHQSTSHYLSQCWPRSLSPYGITRPQHVNIIIHGCFTGIFSCDQAALLMVQSVSRSVHPSVCDTFLTMFLSSYHHEIFRSNYHWQGWSPCKRSRSNVKVTEVKTQFSGFCTLTPVWIHVWQWNDAQSLMWRRRGALLFLKVIRQISRSHVNILINFSSEFIFLHIVLYNSHSWNCLKISRMRNRRELISVDQFFQSWSLKMFVETIWKDFCTITGYVPWCM